MRSAPAVNVQCGHSAAWRGFSSSATTLAVVALGAWGLGQLQLAVWPALVLAPLVAALAWSRLRPLPSTLAWDGQRWWVDGHEGELELMIDLGPWLLLRWRPARAGAPRRWLPVGAAAAGANLHALRAAVYGHPSKASHGARPGDEGQAKEPA